MSTTRPPHASCRNRPDPLTVQAVLTALQEAESRQGQWVVQVLDRLEQLEQGLKQAMASRTTVVPPSPGRPPATHCRYGHSLDDAYVSYGKRYCRPCAKQRARANYEASKVRYETFGEAIDGGTPHVY